MPRKEIWDGKRFAELSWFWDPEEVWLLPVRCPHCHSVTSVIETSKRLDRQEQVKTQIMMLKYSYYSVLNTGYELTLRKPTLAAQDLS